MNHLPTRYLYAYIQTQEGDDLVHWTSDMQDIGRTGDILLILNIEESPRALYFRDRLRLKLDTDSPEIYTTISHIANAKTGERVTVVGLDEMSNYLDFYRHILSEAIDPNLAKSWIDAFLSAKHDVLTAPLNHFVFKDLMDRRQAYGI